MNPSISMENLKVWDMKGEVEVNNIVAYDIKSPQS